MRASLLYMCLLQANDSDKVGRIRPQTIFCLSQAKQTCFEDIQGELYLNIVAPLEGFIALVLFKFTRG